MNEIELRYVLAFVAADAGNTDANGANSAVDTVDHSDGDYRVPEQVDLMALTQAMLDHIGTPDSSLRDGLIYEILAAWIQSGVYSSRQMIALTAIVLDDQHLFYNIDQDDSNAIFTRSFSLLQLPALLMAHTETPFFAPEHIIAIKDALLRYLTLEHDWRGYVDDYSGWAHALAHSADACAALAECEVLDSDDLLALLDALSAVVIAARGVFMYDEDERLSIAVRTVLQRDKLRYSVVEAWLNRLEQAAMQADKVPLQMWRHSNIKNWLRCLYFRLGDDQDHDQDHDSTETDSGATRYLPLVEQALRKIRRY